MMMMMMMIMMMMMMVMMMMMMMIDDDDDDDRLIFTPTRTVFIRLNAAAFIEFFVIRGRRLFKNQFISYKQQQLNV